jgi:hypothetical protein
VRLEGISWYTDEDARERDEPGIAHSYLAGLATALRHLDGRLDPFRLMGASGFAFRIFVNETFCPSAMSVFDWSALLPEAVEQAGHRCTYVSRLWEEGEVEEPRREEAHQAIVEGLEEGRPAVVWDVHEAEWGLIVGCDDRREEYATLTCAGRDSTLPFDRLGRNGIDILSVAIPGESNGRSRDEIVRRSLEAAVAHAEGREWMDRPKYQDGLAAFDLWATLYDRWVLIARAGKSDRLSPDLPRFARYYGAVHYGARCYARDYLSVLADGDADLKEAASAYSTVATALRPVWTHALTLGEEAPTPDDLAGLAQRIRDAKTAEAAGVEALRRSLDNARANGPAR